MKKWIDDNKVFIKVAAVVIEVGVLVVMTVAVLAAFRGNKIARESLQSMHVPWVSVTGVKPSVIDANNFEIAIECKNFSNAPALNFNVRYDILGREKEGQENLYKSDVLMPNAKRGKVVSATVEDGSAEQIVDKLKKGECAFEFIICYEDIFGRRIKVRQVRRWIFGSYRNTAYEVDFLD